MTEILPDTSTVTTVVPTAAALYQSTSESRMVIAAVDNSVVLRIPFAPSEIQYGGFGAQWQEVDRPGRTPILSNSGYGLRTMSFSVQLVGTGKARNTTQEGRLEALRRLSETETPVSVLFGSTFDTRLWRITGFSFTSNRRHPDTDEIVDADVSLSFTQVSDATASVGPASGGISSGRGIGGWSVVPMQPANVPGRTHTVVAGDTLSAIALTYYGDATRWTDIAALNDIKDPTELEVGVTLELP